MGTAFLSVADFQQHIKRIGRTITIIKVDRTVDSYGSETLSDTTPIDVEAIFFKQKQSWTFDKIGEIEGGQAVALIKYSDGVDRNDLILADNERYLVKEAVHVPGRIDTSGVTFVYTYCNLFLEKG